jgi:hypothetical protein
MLFVIKLEDISYEPRLTIFKMDIMRAMGIKETRRPKRTY